MNAILEASVVAASTQGPEDFEQGAVAGAELERPREAVAQVVGAVAGAERIMLASQGSWMNAGICAAYHCGDIFSFARL